MYIPKEVEFGTILYKHWSGKLYRSVRFNAFGREMVLCDKDGFPRNSRLFRFPYREVDIMERIVLPFADCVEFPLPF